MAETAATAPTTAPATATATTQAKPKVTLYWLEKSRAHRILWMMEELNVPYELKTYKRGKDLLAGPELKEVHPLGKSPIISVEGPDGKPIVIAESAFIVEYLAKHYGQPGKTFVPTEWQSGKENVVGGETEEWMRYRYFMHFAEGSLMPFLVLALVVQQLKNAPGVPFFIKPIPRIVGQQIEKQFLTRNLDANFAFVEQQLKSSPGGGEFFAGKEPSGADVMLVYPLEAAIAGKVMDAAKYPTVAKWVEKIHERPAYKAAIARVEKETGEKFKYPRED